MKLLVKILAPLAAVAGAVALVVGLVVWTTPRDEVPVPAGPEHRELSEQPAPPADKPHTSTTPKPAATSGTAESSAPGTRAASAKAAPANARGPAPEELAIGPRAANPETRTYVVKPGDTPAAIAEQQLGAAFLWPEIARLNPGLEARSLQIGQILNLPAAATAAAPIVPAAAMAQKPVPAPGAQQTSGAALATHRVAQGDSLYQLARRYYGDGSRWTLIREANPELQGNGVQGLRLDSELIIPALPGPGR